MCAVARAKLRIRIFTISRRERSGRLVCHSVSRREGERREMLTLCNYNVLSIAMATGGGVGTGIYCLRVGSGKFVTTWVWWCDAGPTHMHTKIRTHAVRYSIHCRHALCRAVWPSAVCVFARDIKCISQLRKQIHTNTHKHASVRCRQTDQYAYCESHKQHCQSTRHYTMLVSVCT